ncbi:MAG: FAD binding domain-containing protein, partial [Desulfatiglandales bacterium]
MKKFDYYQPQSLKDAYNLMEKWKGRAKYIAGGTDIIVRVKQKAIQPDALISLRGIRSLKNMDSKDGLSLGSMTLFRDLERNPAIAMEYPALGQAVQLLANPQVRNVATVGG